MIKNEGFTLIEVVVTLLILTVGLLGMAALTVSVIQGNAQSNKITTATTLAQDKLEEMKTIGYPVADADKDNETIDGFERKPQVVAGDDDHPGTNTVTVTVSWDSNSHSVALSTIISE